MIILHFGGPSSIVKSRLPSHFARSGHILQHDFNDCFLLSGDLAGTSGEQQPYESMNLGM